jgi:O-methyltransferase
VGTEIVACGFVTLLMMPTPSESDVDFQGNLVAERWSGVKHGPEDGVVGGLLARAPLSDVKANMRNVGYSGELINYVEGRVEDTLAVSSVGDIALLRLDTDWYESTRLELELLWDRLQPNGVLIIDDYGHWQGARRAVDEFFQDRSDAPLLCRVDYTARIAVKR